MAFGLVFSSIISGLSLAVWALLDGHSAPVALLFHALGGTVGALLFIAFALVRPGLRDRALVAQQSPSMN